MAVSRPRYELLRTHLDTFTRALRRVERGDVRAIHRTRIASRRLRELLPVLQGDVDVSRRALRDLRRGTRELGRLRELDVLGQLLEALRSQAAEPSGPALATVLEDVRASRRDATAGSDYQSLGRRLTRVARRLEKVLHTLERDDSTVAARQWRWAVQARVARRAGRARMAIEDAGAVYLPDRLHEVRKSVKKLRYAVELLQQSGGKVSTRPVLASLKRWQQVLGDLHDQQTVIDRIRRLEATSVGLHTRRVEPALDVVLGKLEVECRRLHGRYLRGQNGLLAVCDHLSSLASAATPRQPVRRRSVRVAATG